MRPRRPAALVALLAAGATLAAVKGADLGLLAEVRAIAGAVETLREQRFERPPVAVRAPDAMRRVAAEIRAFNVLPRERLEARGRAWADVGLGGASTPATLLTTLAADLDGVGFDPDGHRLLVAPGRLPPRTLGEGEGEGESDADTVLLMTGVRLDEPLVGHMLMHLRQHERERGALLERTTDGLLARAAWFEGEANLVAIRRLFGGMGLADEILDTRLDPGDVLDGRLVPPGIERLAGIERGLVDFVYREGFARAVETFRAGGWPALDAAIDERRLTRDLLHPQRVGRPTARFAEPEPPAPGLALVDRDSLGEQAIVVLVATQTGKINLGLMAGDGWAGDRLERWEPAGDPAAGVTRWETAWVDEGAAEDFRYAIGRTLDARFPGRGEAAAWGAAGRRLTLVREGERVRVTAAPGG